MHDCVSHACAAQEAQEIFGDVSDLLEEYGQRKQHRDGDAEDDLDLLEDEDEDEDAAEERQRLAVRSSNFSVLDTEPRFVHLQPHQAAMTLLSFGALKVLKSSLHLTKCNCGITSL